MRVLRRTFVLLILGSLGVAPSACTDAKRPLGALCGESSECADGECLGGYCLEPLADSDSDGLLNEIEAALGTDPTKADTDGDGTNDGDEIGANVQSPLDADADGHVDAVESKLVDADADCIVNQLDPADAVPETDPHVLASFVCKHEGVCVATGASVTASCVPSATAGKNAASCDYSGVPGYVEDETACNDKDDDCDGTVDERFGVSGEVVFAEVGGQTRFKGQACGVGACAGGLVVCADSETLTCASLTQVAAEVCNAADDDCDGATDEDFAAGGTHSFDGGPNPADAGKVLGAACGVGACSGGTVVCAATDATKLTCASLVNAGPKACHSDANCDGAPDVAADGETLAGCTNFWRDDDGDDFGYGDPVCLCDASVDYPAAAAGDCNEKDLYVHPNALPLCGIDADCDENLVDTMEVCDDGNDVFWDGCHGCQLSELIVTKLGNAVAPTLAAGADGGFAIEWDLGYEIETYQGRELHFYDATHELARYTGVGSDLWGGPAVWMVGLRGGGYLELWQATRDGYYTLFAQSYSAGGVAVGDPVLVADSESQTSFYDGQLVALDGHRAAFVYPQPILDATGSGMRIVGFYFGADGKVEAGGRLEFDPGGPVYAVGAAGMADGQLVAAFRVENYETYDASIYFQRVGVDKAPAGKITLAHGQPELQQSEFAVATLPAGAWALVYLQDDPVAPEGTDRVLYVQHIDANGAPTGDKLKLPIPADVYVYELDAAANARGDLVVAGSSERNMGEPPAWLVHAGGGVTPLSLGTAELLSSPGGTEVVALANGDFLVSFSGWAGEAGGGGFLSRINADGARVPVFPPAR